LSEKVSIENIKESLKYKDEFTKIARYVKLFYPHKFNKILKSSNDSYVKQELMIETFIKGEQFCENKPATQEINNLKVEK
jgi:hypothetical protein